ncbi:MAG: substrate-binding domain-containing protein [Nitrospiraceae bacterium]
MQTASFANRLHRIGRAWRTTLALSLLSCVLLTPALVHAEARGGLVIAGSGPELPMIEHLVQAFEKAQSGVYVDVLWDATAKPTDQVRNGEAQLAVTGAPESDLHTTQVAWDGIGVIVHLSNLAKDLTKQQIGEIFSGKYATWSEIGGPDTTILIIDRPPQQNVRSSFEQQLGIAGKIAGSAKVIGQDEQVIKSVVGTLPPKSAVAYLSLEQALAAVHSGVAIRLLSIDKVEPEEPTVKDGRYPLRRPVLLLSKQDRPATAVAFEAFCASPAGQKIIDEFYTPFAP